MPFIANTPESSPGVTRSDSRNPATTCKGITSTGNACKRAVSSHKLSAVSSSPFPVSEELYCWQHKSQAATTKWRRIHPATSIETLVERLKISDKQSSPTSAKFGSEVHQKSRSSAHVSRSYGAKRAPQPRTRSRLCCFAVSDDDEDERIEIVRHKNRVQHRSQPRSLAPAVHDHQNPSPDFHQLIPRTLPLNVKLQLQRELTKSISDPDPGYIYVYRKVASSNTSGQGVQVGLSDLPQRTAQDSSPRKILIKIGYTKNVQMRLSTWSSKCRSQIELLRYYPYVAFPSTPRKAPYCRVVERLIHIELGEKRVQQACDCGTTHREWFEIDASIQAVKSVNEVIQRWISWAEASNKP